MRHSVTFAELLDLHRMMIDAIGGSHGVRDPGAVESALAQPFMSFGGEDFYILPWPKKPRLWAFL